jgi:hypothetical protein
LHRHTQSAIAVDTQALQLWMRARAKTFPKSS